jgi:hypothetical protein
MRRVTLVIALAVVMAAIMAQTVGPAPAKDTQPKQEYVDTVKAGQYFASPGVSMFFGEAKDIEDDGDPGLQGELDTRITYAGTPGPGVTNPITGGSWLLCSQFTAEFKEAIQGSPLVRASSEPECEDGSAIVLQGKVRDGTAVWRTDGQTAFVPTSRGCIPVYGGIADVEAVFTVTDGEVNGVPVTKKGIGMFKGELDHRPLLLYDECDPTQEHQPLLTGTLKLKF